MEPEEPSSFEFSTTRLGKEACPEGWAREEKRSSGGSFGQGMKEPGFFWKLSTLAKTRWKDQSGLYELAFMVSSPPPRSDFPHL